MGDEEKAFRWVNRGGPAQMLILCDHAANAVPGSLDGLGLDQAALRGHIAWDIGAAKVAQGLAKHFDAPAIISGYSRLVIDCNRYLDDPASIPTVSDGVAVPGNASLTVSDIAWRQETVFWPYHHAIEAALDRFAQQSRPPVLLSIHSFTRIFGNDRRPWDVGICWRHDHRMAAPVLRTLREDPSIEVGDNRPYSLDPAEDYSLIEYGLNRGFAHLLVEICNDGIADDAGVGRWTALLAAAIDLALKQSAVYEIRPNPTILASR